MSDEYGEEAEEVLGVLGATVDVKVRNCVLVIVEVTVPYEGTRNRGSRIRVNRIVIINRERKKRLTG